MTECTTRKVLKDEHQYLKNKACDKSRLHIKKQDTRYLVGSLFGSLEPHNIPLGILLQRSVTNPIR